jgi:hypothetical protein
LSVTTQEQKISKYLIKIEPRKSLNKSVIISKELPAAEPSRQPYIRRVSSSVRVDLLGIKSAQFDGNQEASSEKSAVIDEFGTVEDIFAKRGIIARVDSLLPMYWWRPVSAFMIMALLLVSPLQVLSYYRDLDQTKHEVISLTNQAIDRLTTGSQNITQFDLASAAVEFSAAQSFFDQAVSSLGSVDTTVQGFITVMPKIGQYYNSAETLLVAGTKISAIARELSSIGTELQQPSAATLYQTLVKISESLTHTVAEFETVAQALATINPEDVPLEYRQRLDQMQSALPVARQAITQAQQLSVVLLERLGADQWQRYLILFANNNELRAVGGFLGSYAQVDIDRGQIKQIEVPTGGSYATQGQLTKHVVAPEPLQLINARWEMQDANWWPDFPTSAKKVDWFYRNSGGPSTDGVVLVTSKLIEQLLEVVGPIEMPEYNRTITAQNFETETQQVVEIEYDRAENKPKQFIGDLAPQLLEKVLASSGEQAQRVLQVIRQSLVNKDIVLFFADSTAQSVVQRLGWAGATAQTSGDYLSIIHTNVAGGKTDAVIDNAYDLRSAVNDAGVIVNTLTIARTHNGVHGANQFTGVQNNDYIRIYVPRGSKLISATGFSAPARELFDPVPPEYPTDLDLLTYETGKSKDHNSGTDVYVENGATVFGNWLQLPAGESKSVVVTYQLPMTSSPDATHTLLIQKQSGATNESLTYALSMPGPWAITTKAHSAGQTIDMSSESLPIVTDTLLVSTKLSKQ